VVRWAGASARLLRRCFSLAPELPSAARRLLSLVALVRRRDGDGRLHAHAPHVCRAPEGPCAGTQSCA
jgi:hypothetical protein